MAAASANPGLPCCSWAAPTLARCSPAFGIRKPWTPVKKQAFRCCKKATKRAANSAALFPRFFERNPTMKRFRKVYLEISNRCNLRCAFCPGTKRKSGAMDALHFAAALQKLRPYTDYLYFHLMGEPLCHPNLEQYLSLAAEAGFKVILTTNGTLLSSRQDILLNAPALHKINISLHAFEANDLAVPFESYLSDCIAFGQAAQSKKIVVYRLWNNGGADERKCTSVAPA